MGLCFVNVTSHYQINYLNGPKKWEPFPIHDAVTSSQQ